MNAIAEMQREMENASVEARGESATPITPKPQ
jgi:hypothetical protein